MAEGQDIVDYLVAHGAYVEAARLCVERGALRRAIQLYERVWRFADAVPLALQVGDRPLALRLCLDAGDPGRAAEIASQIPTDARAELLAACDALAGRGRPFEAARLAERALDFARAATLYRRASAALDAGRALELAGQLHEAGLLYERLAAEDAGTAPAAATLGRGFGAGGAAESARPGERPRAAEGEAAAARLALGRLLGRLGRHQEAARRLQQAVRHPAVRHEAQRALVVELLALGLRRAAGEVLARLRRRAPELPALPEAFVAQEAGAGGPQAGAEAADGGLLRRRFRIIKLLGAGATGRVYLAEDTLLGQRVAVKLLAVGAGATGAERQAYHRFARESEAAGRLRHPNIVTLYDMDEALGLFVFELMSGGTLAERIAGGGALSPAAARRMALELLAALGAAHERGIVHRDVKPANVFFDAAGNAKLGDFGAAHLVDFGQTQTGGLVGTVAYMAPEQITGATIDAAADLYALGVTLFEALTGRAPFLGPDIVAQHLGEPPPPLTRVRGGLGAAHDEVIARLLAKAPGDRHASAEELAAAIREWPTALGAVGAEVQASDAAGRRQAGEQADDDDGDGEQAGGGDTAAVEAEREIGRTGAGRLLARRDARVGRPILVEERDTALDGADLEHVQALAAAGGPNVQRILALSDDRRSVIYEAILGAVVGVDALSSADQAALVGPLQALREAGAEELARLPSARVALTPGGPVILIAPVPHPA